MILEPRPSNTGKQIEQLATKVLLRSIELLGGSVSSLNIEI